MSDVIVNKVAESALTELNLEDYYPQEEIAVFDLKDYLFMGLILKEKDFREALKSKSFDEYRDKYVAVNCSADAIIPMWAYMLIAAYLQPIAREVFFGDAALVHQTVFSRKLTAIDTAEFKDKRVVVKGCGKLPVGEFAYLEITKLLRPVVKSIMYGEACSTVPIFKQSIKG